MQKNTLHTGYNSRVKHCIRLTINTLLSVFFLLVSIACFACVFPLTDPITISIGLTFMGFLMLGMFLVTTIVSWHFNKLLGDKIYHIGYVRSFIPLPDSWIAATNTYLGIQYTGAIFAGIIGFTPGTPFQQDLLVNSTFTKNIRVIDYIITFFLATLAFGAVIITLIVAIFKLYSYVF